MSEVELSANVMHFTAAGLKLYTTFWNKNFQMRLVIFIGKMITTNFNRFLLLKTKSTKKYSSRMRSACLPTVHDHHQMSFLGGSSSEQV